MIDLLFHFAGSLPLKAFGFLAVCVSMIIR